MKNLFKKERVKKRLGAPPPKEKQGCKEGVDGNVEKKAEEYPEVDRLIEDFKKLSSREKKSVCFSLWGH